MDGHKSFPLTELPLDILDPILSHIEYPDLVSFAAVSRACKELVIPRHAEYRVLRLESNRPAVWAHLAQRPDLARNIRRVTIIESDELKNISERCPVTLVESAAHCTGRETEMSGEEAEMAASNIFQALGNMHSLRSFSWLNPSGSFYDVPEYRKGILQVLRESKSLVELKIVDTNDSEEPGPAQDENYPLWHISDLHKLSLRHMGWWPEGLVSMLLRSPNLQTLSITPPVSSPTFMSSRWPRLRKLHLITTPITDAQAIAEFLQNHPSIEELHWYPRDQTLQLSPGSLPVLRRLITSPDFARSVLVDPTVPHRAMEQISQLSIDDPTLALLATINTSRLRDLRIWKYSGLEAIGRVAALLPALTHLEIPMFGIATRDDEDKEYTIDDYILTLSRFQHLEHLISSSLFSALRLAGEEKITMLANMIPTLTRLGHFSSQKSAYVDIVLSRDGKSVSWTEEEPLWNP
ncbi:hypothetical protein C8J57DRAFT_266599 [Mycena rebaudengoi]|nr:hypothetical protein C8J57DRAFT_266599 [Mycena rebaudengoi]